MSDKEEKKALTSENQKESKSEVLYVPIEYLQSVQDNEDRIDIFELLRIVWNGRMLILKVMVLFIVIGIFTAITSIEEFTSEVKLIPESQQTLSLGGLGGLARQFGVIQSEPTSRESIQPALYPDITSSTYFLQRLLDVQITLTEQQQRTTIFEYLLDHQKTPVSNTIKRYTIRLPVTIWNRFTSSRNAEEAVPVIITEQVSGENRVLRLSNREWNAIRGLRGRINTSLDRETRFVSVSVTMQNAEISAEIADKVVALLSEYVTEYRTEKTRQDMEFIEERFHEAKEEFEKSQEELALFLDHNRGQLTALAQTRQQLLQSRYDLTFNIYNAMAERLENARIKLQEETPVLSIMEPPIVPDRNSEPNRKMIIIIHTMLGGMMGVALVFGLRFWETLKVELNL